MKFDKSKPHGVISGDHHGAMFEQDGRLFGADEQEIIVVEAEADIDEHPAVVEAPAKKTPGRKKTPAVVEAPASAVDEQIAAQAGV